MRASPRYVDAAEVADNPAIVGRLHLPAAIRARAAAVRPPSGPFALSVGVGCAITAVAGTIGADARWLPALGRAILRDGAIPQGVPFAAAPSNGWPNVPVLSELVLNALTAAFGDRGFLLAQLVAVAFGLTALGLDMRRNGASEASAGLIILLIVIGALPALLIIRVQLFSLFLFPVLALLLRAESRTPSRRVWLLVPLLALWSNLHGAALVGIALAAAYLVLSRARVQPLTAVAVLAASLVGLCATPALERTPTYYVGVLQNEAARRGEGLWAPLSFSSGFDLLLIATAVVLIALAFRSRPRLWEIVALVGLAVFTVRTQRSGVWLLLFAGPPAATALHLSGRPRRVPLLAAGAVAVVLVVIGLARGPLSNGAGSALLDDSLHRAGGTPILADGAIAEQVAFSGGRVWMSNPLDAFHLRDQRIYLDWIDGRPTGLRALARAPRVVLVSRHSHAASVMAHSRAFRAAAADSNAILYVRERGG